jgi:flagellar hook assembly protein FlgD
MTRIRLASGILAVIIVLFLIWYLFLRGPSDMRHGIVLRDAAGREINTLVNEEQQAGTYRVTWNGVNGKGVRVSSGVYYYQIRTKNGTETKKAVLVK